jgi:flagellar assembly protein FliH
MSAQKFIFDRQFGGNAPGSSVFVKKEETEPVITVAEHEKIVALARLEGEQKGFVEGQASARGEETARLATAEEHLSAALRNVWAEINRIEVSASREAINFALVFAERLSTEMSKRFPLEPIEESARRAFKDLRGAPHIVARVAPELVDEVKRRLSRMALEGGIDGKLIVLGEPEISRGDCRIEWADGGVVRDRAQLIRKLHDVVTLALAQADQQTMLKQVDSFFGMNTNGPLNGK